MPALEYSFDELMSDDAYEEPLIAGGVRCHGGYLNGAYVSPRLKARRPAIDAWRGRLAAADAPLVCVPARYVPQPVPQPRASVSVRPKAQRSPTMPLPAPQSGRAFRLI